MLDIPEFQRALVKYLPHVDANYVTLVQSSTILSSKYTLCVSLNHIDRLVTKGSLRQYMGHER